MPSLELPFHSSHLIYEAVKLQAAAYIAAPVASPYLLLDMLSTAEALIEADIRAYAGFRLHMTMGSIASKAILVVYASLQASKTYDLLKKRLKKSPGLPVQNPTLPLWAVPPAAIPRDPLGALPDYADIVIIGSGITGTSFAYNAYAHNAELKTVMLEARDVCSGATGRNGGHINPPLYHDYGELKQQYGKDAAQAMVNFRLSHFEEMQSISSTEDILKESQCRETEHLDVYTNRKSFEDAKESLAQWRAEMPSAASSFTSHERQDAIETYHLSEQVVGCISNSGGAMHPYRFVTSLLSILLARHWNKFQIFPHTPCTEISSPNYKDPHPHLYTVHTPRGTIRTPHIVHATNGWSSHLLLPLRSKIVPVRGAMSAQRPGTSIHRSTLDGARSFIFYRGTTGYDYLTQLPTGEREMMFGGGWNVVFGEGHDDDNDDGADVPDIGIVDDSRVGHAAQSYLAGALPQYFGLRNWGAEGAAASAESADKDKASEWGAGRTKAQWSGILGISVDGLPWVGRLPAKVCGRTPPKVVRRGRVGAEGAGKESGVEMEATVETAAPGEWIAAGYSGEGMVHAWMSGKALACMVLDQECEDGLGGWFPEVLRVTEKRWREANVDKFFARFF